MRKKRTVLSLEIRNLILKEYIDGDSSVFLAKKYNCSKAQVRNILIKNNIPRRGTGDLIGEGQIGKIQDKIEEIKKLYEEGNSSVVIAKKYGFTKNGVIEALWRNGVHLRSGIEAAAQRVINKNLPTKEWLEAQLSIFNGNASRCAKSLNINYSTFRSYLAKHKIPRKGTREIPEWLEKAKTLSMTGRSYAEISFILNVSERKIRHQLVRSGYLPSLHRNPKLDPIKRNKKGKNRTDVMKDLRYNGITSCEICGITDPLDLAHIIPSRNGGSWDLENILLLCPNHHRLFDGGRLPLEDTEKIRNRVYASIASANFVLKQFQLSVSQNTSNNVEDKINDRYSPKS